MANYSVLLTVGRRARLCSGDEEQYNDLLTLMELLTNLMTKDFVDLSLSGKQRVYSCFEFYN